MLKRRSPTWIKPQISKPPSVFGEAPMSVSRGSQAGESLAIALAVSGFGAPNV
jgi:hypothetical protein